MLCLKNNIMLILWLLHLRERFYVAPQLVCQHLIAIEHKTQNQWIQIAGTSNFFHFLSVSVCVFISIDLCRT